MLRREEKGEADRRLTLLTPERGKIEAVAKGARKSGSRLAGCSEVLCWSRLGLAESRYGRFITQSEPQTSFPGLRDDYERLTAALAWAELLDAAIPLGLGAEHFGLALMGLHALADHPRWQAALVWAEARLLEAEGQSPEWMVDALTGEPITQTIAWVCPAAGGVIAGEPSIDYRDRTEVGREALIGLARIGSLTSPPPNLKNAEQCLQALHAWWRSTLERPLRAHSALLEG